MISKDPLTRKLFQRGRIAFCSKLVMSPEVKFSCKKKKNYSHLFTLSSMKTHSQDGFIPAFV